jgi:hypothetical protein
VAAEDEILKETFLALELDFQNKTYSFSAIGEKPNENSPFISAVTNRTVKQLIIE